jgi:hypothetical protein
VLLAQLARDARRRQLRAIGWRLACVGRNIRLVTGLKKRTGDAAKWSAPSLPQIAPVDPCAGGVARYRPSTGNGIKPMLAPPHVGCLSVAPLLPQPVQRAH